jgi:ABC-type branched-subunit amino acid transport system substrate-binding protein
MSSPDPGEPGPPGRIHAVPEEARVGLDPTRGQGPKTAWCRGGVAVTGGDRRVPGQPAPVVESGAHVDIAMAFKTIESDVKAHGGVAGHKLQIILTNDQGNPTTAVTLAQQLVSEHVAGIVYPGFPASAAQTIPYFDKQQVPVVFADPPPTGSNSDPYYFNTFATTAQQYQVLAEYIKAEGTVGGAHQ